MAMPNVDSKAKKQFEAARASLSVNTKRKSSTSEGNPIREVESFNFDVEMSESNIPQPNMAQPEDLTHETISDAIRVMTWYMRAYGLESPSWQRPLTTIWYVLIRVLAFVGLIVKCSLYFELSPIMLVACDIPMTLAFVVSCLAMIPAQRKCNKLRRELQLTAEERRSRGSSLGGNDQINSARQLSVTHGNAKMLFLRGGDMSSAGKVATQYVASFVILGIIASALVASGKAKNPSEWLADFLIYLALTSLSTPALGAVLFALRLDVARVRNDLTVVAKFVAEKTLELERYSKTQERALEIKRSWNWHLNTVAAVALYNSVGMVILAPMNAGMSLEVYLDLIIFVSMGKEMILFIVILVFVMKVNDDADEISSTLALATWGEFNSEAEWRRNKLFILSTYTGPASGSQSSVWKYLKTARVRPVSFTLFGIRPTMRLVIGISVSLAISAVASMSHRITDRLFDPDRSMEGMSEM